MTERPPHQMTFDLGHNVSYEEDDFVVSDGNRLAFEHIKNYADWANQLTLISGPAKSGKSHLAGIWASLAGALAIKAEDGVHLGDLPPEAPILLEDVDRQAFDEHWLFHMLNQGMRGERTILMTARQPVSEWPYVTADVKSRAKQAVHLSVAAADDMQLTHMFVKLLSDRQIQVDLKIVAYLVSRMVRSAEEVVVLTALIDKLSLAKGRAITRAIAAEALAERDRQLDLNV